MLIPSMQRLRARQGFTLIEILIVVAIIGILASVVLVGLGPVQRQGRDARRISDLKQVQNGLELYYAKNGNYPTPNAGGGTMAWSDLTTAVTGAGIGVSNVPDDPNVNAHYLYGAGPNGADYTLGATLEDSGNPALTQSPKGTLDGVNCNSPVYCVKL